VHVEADASLADGPRTPVHILSSVPVAKSQFKILHLYISAMPDIHTTISLNLVLLKGEENEERHH